MTKKKSNLKRTLAFTGVGVVLVALIAGWNIYNYILAPNVQLKNRVTAYLYIPTGGSFRNVTDSLTRNDLLKDVSTFEWVAERMNYIDKVRPGRYLIKNGMNNRQLVTLLRSGKQELVNVTFNNIRTLEQFAGRISALLEADSVSIINIFRNDTLLKENNLNQSNNISILIPNTYEFYWNTNAVKLYERMLKEYRNFWNASRTEKLSEIQLTREQVVTIASIVEQETRKEDEKPVVAGVYVNRFKQGWKLEADPTLVYAVGDFNIRRVLNEHKEVESPYNTYKYAGLPPGPICIPSISSVDAVLNYAHHDYFYFCAKDDFSGYHAFASNLSDHMLNARRFHRALTQRGIMN